MMPAWMSFVKVFLRDVITPLPSRTKWTTYRSIPGTIPKANARTGDLEESTMMGFPVTARTDSKNASANLAYDRNAADGLRFSYSKRKHCCTRSVGLELSNAP